MGGKILDLVKRGIEIYNRYRSPEATAQLISVEGNRVKVRFTGVFCKTCGIRDWLEDYAYFLQELGLEASLLEMLEEGELDRVGIFEVRGSDP